jgi:dTDP-4-amino-4,6-dideoxygalactose transaminase
MGLLAVGGGAPVRSEPFPQWPQPTEQDVDAVCAVIRSGQWHRISRGQSGETKARQFEKAFAAYQGAGYGLAVSSGTAAVEVALRAVGIEPGDEVVMPAHSFMATASAALMVGGIPVFVDIDPRTYNIDPAKIEQAITPATRAIVPVHFGGLPCDMDSVLSIAETHDLAVVEDACHGHGGRWRDKGLGTIGDIGAFSIGDGKNLAVGEGGVIPCNDEALWARAVYLHDAWGGGIGKPFRDVQERGFPLLSWNYRITEIQSALALSLLKRLESQSATRWENARYLDERLSAIGGVRPMRTDSFVTRNALHIYMFQYTGEGFAGLSRGQFLKALQAEGIPVSGGYTRTLYQHPLFTDPESDLNKGKLSAFRSYDRIPDYRNVRCPEAERLCHEETAWIPHRVLLGTTKDMDDVIQAIWKIKQHVDEAIACT